MNSSDNKMKMKHRCVLDMKKDLIKLEQNFIREKMSGKALCMRVSKLEREIGRLSIKKHPRERKEDPDQPQFPPEVSFASTDIRYKVRKVSEVDKMNTWTESKGKQQTERESEVAIPWWKMASCSQWPRTEYNTQETTVPESKPEKETKSDTNHWWSFLESPQWPDLALEELLAPGTRMSAPPASLPCQQLVPRSTLLTKKHPKSSYKIIDCGSGSDSG